MTRPYFLSTRKVVDKQREGQNVHQSGTYRIRPAGRLILTIGRDLIQDRHAAVLELVKNAYDADSPDVEIVFRAEPVHDICTIIIGDHGHGMTRETVIGKWMVPSTPDKVTRRLSPSGRVMQGRKGIGRYAASILGKDLLLETVTPEGEKTTLMVNWNDFEKATYLDDVEIRIETTEVSEHSGTRMTMSGDGSFLKEWDVVQFDRLISELKKLTPPVKTDCVDAPDEENFRIILKITGFPNIADRDEVISPYPIIDLYDYRIKGSVGKDGKGLLTYSSQKARNATSEKIPFDEGEPTGCGDLFLDIRVYDRDKLSIEGLIARGLRNESGKYFGNMEARKILNENNGIGVYRNGFRIRPLGDPGFDWLKLNERRVQNPSLRISSNQVIGYVQIQSDELSGLLEKSARDGLLENRAFSRLKKISLELISKLEERRFLYREKAGLSRSSHKVDTELDRLFSFENLKRDIKVKLIEEGVGLKVAEEVIETINRDAAERNKTANEIRQAVAVYQGQATLGKIINVVLHEGRRPLNYFRNQIPNLSFWYNSFLKSNSQEDFAECLPIVEGIGQNAKAFVALFGRLDPLAAGKRPARKPLKLLKTIRSCLGVFEGELRTQHVAVRVVGDEDFSFPSWQQDIFAIFTNLVDNSLYWMEEKKTQKREILIDLASMGDSLQYVDYRDTGPGIEPSLIESGVIYEPQFSTKPSGMGLGLAIAGEAASRNGLELEALRSEQGAWFRLQPGTEES